jgi:hypothetical protein
MKFIVRVSLPAAKFNAALRDGTAGKKMARILEETKPEAAYFTSMDGERGGFLVYNMSKASEIPGLAEPWFLNFDAKVEFSPAMTPEDLQKAGLEGLVKKWG